MARMPRLLIGDQPTVYHVVTRTALTGHPLGDAEKERLLAILRRLSAVYFAEVLGFCLMGNHFHLLVRMHPGEGVADEEVRRRFGLYYGADSGRVLTEGQLPQLRAKWASLSEYVREIKQSFARWYNRTHGRKGYFWGDRFRSTIVEDGDTVVHCLAYIDLNPVRAGLVERPEAYRWSSLGYHVQTGNRGGFLSLDLGLRPFADWGDAERLRAYRRYVYGVGSLPSAKGASIAPQIVEAEEKKDYALGGLERFRYRMHHFTASGVLGTQAFVAACCRRFREQAAGRRQRSPQPIPALPGLYSFKRLTGS